MSLSKTMPYGEASKVKVSLSKTMLYGEASKVKVTMRSTWMTSVSARPKKYRYHIWTCYVVNTTSYRQGLSVLTDHRCTDQQTQQECAQEHSIQKSKKIRLLPTKSWFLSSNCSISCCRLWAIDSSSFCWVKIPLAWDINSQGVLAVIPTWKVRRRTLL